MDAVRNNDPDRFVLAMLAPETARDALLALYAFNIEIARTRELVSEAMLGEIRLQWWRDEVEAIYAGGTLRHGISGALRDVVQEFRLPRDYFDSLIDARASDLDDAPPATMNDLLRYAESTTAPLLALALEIVGVASPEAKEAVRRTGIAWSLSGLLRALPFQLRARRHYFPRDLFDRHGVVMRDLLDLKSSAALNSAVEEVCEVALGEVQGARDLRPQVERTAVPILIQARFAEIYLRRFATVGYDPFHPQLAGPPAMMVWRLAWTKFRNRY